MTRSFLLLFLAVCLSGCSTMRSAKLLTPTWFDLKEIQACVFVDEEMPQTQQQSLLKTLDMAKKRVTAFFGTPVGDAKVFACSTEECFISHGGVTAKGKAYGDSMLLISPRGLNVVIISHELTHIELHRRVGVWRSMRFIPAWFDEGLAVLVSQDPRYTEQGWLRATEDGYNAPKLDKIGSLLGKGDWLMSYGTARKVVGKWYQQAGRPGLTKLIAEISRGGNFNASLESAIHRNEPSNTAL